ncbi:MAG: anthranilate phosphoribosyltransferase [Candidatus Eremiobacteraeota bacterium]|nr:anthranilate phosphoribosyltransferase [Candidatus Eremiobacteraeota bacterium]
MDFPPLLRRILGGASLSEREAYALVGDIMDGALSPVQSAGLLAGLAAKGEVMEEVAGAARAMRERSLHVEHGLPMVMDVVGTGGDGADTINISTIAAFVVAAAGVPVAKHGNRAASSACGSADVLEAVGLRIDAKPTDAARLLTEYGFAFLFAPHYHPAMKNVAPVRRELGVRTVFNVLGPLTNPARATHQVVGVARESQVDLVADVLQRLGVAAGAVVHGGSGIDEIAGEGPTLVRSFRDDTTHRWTLDPSDFNIHAPTGAIRGGSVDRCAEAFRRILEGERSPRADVVALNAGLALLVAGVVENMAEGLDFARVLLHGGQARDVFERVKSHPYE